MNATIGTESYGAWNCLGRNNDNLPTSGNGRRLLTLCENNNLFIMNSLFESKPIHRKTWYMRTGTFQKRTDYILTERYIKNASTQCRVYRKASIPFESDHRMVVLSCHLPSKATRKETFRRNKARKENSAYNIKQLSHNAEVRSRFSDETESILCQTITATDMASVDDLEKKVVQALTTATERTIAKKGRRKEEWANDEFLNLLEEQRKCKDPTRNKELRNKIKAASKKLKNSYYGKKADEINLASEARDTEREFRMMREHSVLKTKRNNIISPAVLEKHFKEHFSKTPIPVPDEVLNPNSYPHLQNPEECANISVDESQPSQEEAKKIMNSMKTGVCKGSDVINAEQIKYNNSNKLLQIIITMLTLIWSTITVPKTWIHAIITCIYKNKGDLFDPSNYRGLSITATCSKIMIRIIINRLQEMYEALLLPTQFGFRANKSTNDAIYILRNVIDNTSDELYCCFIDLKAAYDWIDREVLFKVLDYRLKAPLLVKLLKCIYTGTTAAIKMSSSVFRTLSGCRQGGLESSSLFNIYLDFVLRCILHEIKTTLMDPGIFIKYAIPAACSNRSQRKQSPLQGVIRLIQLCYADDIVFFAKNVDELQKILNIYDKEFKKFGLKISTVKTKTMCFNVPSNIKDSESLISLGNETIENVQKFTYLGHTLSNDETNQSAFLSHRISSAYAKWNELKSVLTDKRIFMKTRVKFLNACVRSRLTYSVQSGFLNSTEIIRLESIWMNFLRRLIRNGFQRENVPQAARTRRRTRSRASRSSRSSRSSQSELTNETGEDEDIDWRFRLTNQNILTITKSGPISNFCLSQHLKFIAHITRLPNSAIQKQILFRTNKKRYARDPWHRYEQTMGMTKTQIQREMQSKQQFLSLLDQILDTQRAATVNRGS